MTVRKELLEILCCPETKEEVLLIKGEEVNKVNSSIHQGVVKYRDGESVTEKIDAGLLRKDGKFLYPVRDGIPIMLIGKSIDMGTIR